MKIRVQHENGAVEVLTLGEIVAIHRGEHLNRIVTRSGCEHFFTHDGYYDGWGYGGLMKEDEISEILHSMESKREIIS